MKIQYLGDSKDSFKWDYHDYLTNAFSFKLLNILLMMTPDGPSSEGKTLPERFPAREEIIAFCHNLRKERNVELLRELPDVTAGSYRVVLHKPETCFTHQNRREYFSGILANEKQLLFLDPDNGFEPERTSNEKHILYSDINTILKQISEKSIVSVFHHNRRIPFDHDFAYIRERLMGVYVAGVYWHSLMFVAIGKTKEIIKKVNAANEQYSQTYPVKVLR